MAAIPFCIAGRDDGRWRTTLLQGGSHAGRANEYSRECSWCYQAEPFALESHFRNDLKRIGAATWTPIVVNGPTGGHKNLPKKARRKKKPV